MAKHKKPKKFEAMPEPAKDVKESVPEPVKPEIDSPTISTAEPPKEPTRVMDDETKRRIDKLFWLRIIVAATAGTVATIIFEPITGEERRWASIIFMISVFLGTIVVGKLMLIELPKANRKKLITTGIGSFVFIYLFTWILSYTLINLNESTSFGTVDI